MDNKLSCKLIGVTKLCDILNSEKHPVEYPVSGEFNKKTISMRIKNAGITPAQKRGGRAGHLYHTHEILAMLGYKKDKPVKKIEIDDPKEVIENADTSLDAWGIYQAKIKDRVDEAPSPKVAAEIEKIMTATYKDTLDVMEKTKHLLTMGEVQATMERVLSVMKQEMTQIVGKISAVAPELDRKKLVMIRDVIDDSLRKASDELSK